MTTTVELLERAVWGRLDGLPFAVIGLGKSGVAAANALRSRGADVIAWDDAPAERLSASLEALAPGVLARCGEGHRPARGDRGALTGHRPDVSGLEANSRLRAGGDRRD